jgi:hypothetical protein
MPSLRCAGSIKSSCLGISKRLFGRFRGEPLDFKETFNRLRFLALLKKYQSDARWKRPGAGRKKNVPNRASANHAA